MFSSSQRTIFTCDGRFLGELGKFWRGMGPRRGQPPFLAKNVASLTQKSSVANENSFLSTSNGEHSTQGYVVLFFINNFRLLKNSIVGFDFYERCKAVGSIARVDDAIVDLIYDKILIKYEPATLKDFIGQYKY